MTGIMFGMISYLPDDEPRRSIRFKQTLKTIKNVCGVAAWVGKNLNLAITNWKDKEFAEVFGLNIVFHTIPMEERGPARSRNELLKVFYSSDFDYLLMCDDDIAFYPHYDIKEFFRLIDRSPELFIRQKLWYICSLLSSYAPYKEANMKDPDFTENWVFTAGGNVAGMCPQIWLNLKKYFGQELYQEHAVCGTGEDAIFSIELMKRGFMPYTLTALITGTTEIASTAWQEEKSKKEMLKEAVWKEGQPTLDWLIQHYPKLRQRTKYKLDFSGYYPKHLDRVLIPREVLYQFKDTDVVVKRKIKMPKGLLR